jgi:6-phospho-3-hexuloisomerase
MFKKNYKTILGEIDSVLHKTDENQIELLIDSIANASTIVAVGAGRVGMVTKAFVMRLGHFGFKAFFIGDTTVPSIGEGDLLLACSGSGETQTIYNLVEIAKKNKAKISLITGNRDSSMGKISDYIIELKAPSKTKKVDGFESVQPMTTLNEQCLHIFFDTLTLLMMEKLNENHDTMWRRHSNLE